MLSGTESDKETVVGVIEKIVKELRLSLKQCEEKPKKKIVWYLDTSEHDFYKNNDFTVRVKEKEKENEKEKFEYDVTFKIRTSEKDKTLSYDLGLIPSQDEFNT